MHKLFIISGPSGSGQDSVIEGLLAQGLNAERVITTTTRAMRPGEGSGRPYYFIAPDQFKRLIKAGQLVEWDYHYNHYYGCTYAEYERIKGAGKIALWKMDMQGALAIKRKLPQARTIYIKPPSVAAALARIQKRPGASRALIEARRKEIEVYLKPENDKNYDFVVINQDGQLAAAVSEAAKIIAAETV